jgi:DNA polymerase gamma 1
MEPKIKLMPSEVTRHILGYDNSTMTKRELQRFSEAWAKAGLSEVIDRSEPVDLGLPPESLEDTLVNALRPYQATLDTLEAIANADIPEMPGWFPTEPGWYTWDGSWESGAPQPGSNSVIDFETVKVNGDNDWRPACCVLLDPLKGHWYAWVADEPLKTTLDVPGPFLGIGHNAPYDRSFVTAEYLQAESGNRWFDTMAAWMAVRGYTNQQRGVYKEYLKCPRMADAMPWLRETGDKSLDALSQFYLGEPLDKGVRDIIVQNGWHSDPGFLMHVQGEEEPRRSMPQDGRIWMTRRVPEGLWAYSPGVKEIMGDVLSYCAKDVLATFKIFRHLWFEWANHQPTKVSQAAQIALGSAWLPMSPERFPGYADNARRVAQETMGPTLEALEALATQLAYRYLDTLKGIVEDSKDHPRASRAAWVDQSTQGFTRGLPRRLQSLDWTPGRSGKTLGLPAWYRKLGEVSIGARWVPLVLGATWDGHEIYWEDDRFKADGRPLPHPEERGKRVTGVFIKGYVKRFEEGTLAVPEDFSEIVSNVMSLVNWKSLESRVDAIKSEEPEGFPVVIPRITVTGTVTRRCADNLWQVLPNPKKTRVGTELKSMVQAPPGYVIIGADVASQEAWLAGAIADSTYGYCGATPAGLVTLVGDKSDGSDLHSKVAQNAGISRDLAKNLNYGAIYGLGFNGAKSYLLKSQGTLDESEAERMTDAYLKAFKGERSDYGEGYTGGLFSEAFNAMAKIANAKVPRSPLTQAKMTRALAGVFDYSTTRKNWVIQTSGADFRDYLVILTIHFWDLLGVRGRLLMTIHDEIRLVCLKEHIAKAALGLQWAHLYTRAAFIDAFGLDGIPQAIAWFPEIDVDHVLRKDPLDPQITPSQPEGLPLGYCLTPVDIAGLPGIELGKYRRY